MLRKLILISVFVAGLSSVLSNYIKDMLSIEFSYIFLGIFSVIALVIFKIGISMVVKSSLKVGIIQSIMMGIFTSLKVPLDYSILKWVTLASAILFSIFGFNKIKELLESMVLAPLGLIKKTYDTKFYNIHKDNANIDLSIEEIDALGDNGRDFEVYIARIYRALGMTAKTTMELKEENDLPACIMKRSGNGEQGADVIVFFNAPETLFGEVYDGVIIQCKHYSNKVENKAIQEVVGAVKMYEKHFMRKLKPVVITNNYYTGPAEDLAKANNVILIDRDSLPSLVKEAVDQIKQAKNSLIA